MPPPMNSPSTSPARQRADEGCCGVHATAWLVVGSLAAVMLLPVLVLRGMSLDGIIYATVSRNLAVHIGSFWHPVYTAPPTTFYEHPPLAFWLESMWFRVLGDHWWVERLYSVSTAIPSGWLTVLIWRRLVGDRQPWRQYAWLGVAMWVLMPAWPWIYRNNFLENTLSVFTLFSVYATVRAMSAARGGLVWTSLAALGIAAAILTKGPVGLFPLIAPAAFWLAMGGGFGRCAVLVQAGLIAALVLILAVVFAQSEPREFFATYLSQQVFDSLQGQREMTPSPLGRLGLLVGLVQDLWLTAGIACALVYLHRKQSTSDLPPELRGAFRFCGMMALAASLPIMISPKQTAYYAAPSWPLYALTLAAWSCAAVNGLIERASALSRYARWLTLVRRGAIGAVTLALLSMPLVFGRYLRDRALIEDVDRIGQTVAAHGTVEIGPALQRSWNLHAYLFRRHYITLERHWPSADFYLDALESAPHDAAGRTPGLAGYVLMPRPHIAIAEKEHEAR